MAEADAIACMKYEWVEVEDLAAYAADPAWVAEQKLDGVRCMVRVTPKGEVRFLSHGGALLKSAAAALHFGPVTQALAPLTRLGRDVVLDGELLPSTGKLWLFDLPYYEGIVRPGDLFSTRRRALEMVCRELRLANERVAIVSQVRGEEAMLALAEMVEAAGAEGVMLKRLDSTYESNRRVKHHLKVKFTKTADCVVLARNVGKPGTLNAHLGAYEPCDCDAHPDYRSGEDWHVDGCDGVGALVQVGSCSMIGKPDAQPGDVVEVKYLYATESRVLYQPRLERIRVDKAATDCLVSQLVPVNRTVVEVSG